MRGTVIYGAGDVRSEVITDPVVEAPTDVIVRTAATCVCGSDLWQYRGLTPGVPHDVSISGEELFSTQVGLRGGPAPVRRFLPDLIGLVLDGRISPGKVFDLRLPVDQVTQA